MKAALLFLTLLFHQAQSLSCRTCARDTTGPRTDALIIGQYIDWKYYTLESYGAVISNINASIYTHIVMTVSSVSNKSCIISDRWISLQNSFTSTTLGSDTNDPYKGILNQVRKLKLLYPHLKVVLGMTDAPPSTKLSVVAADSTFRTQLAQSCVNMMLQYGLDGIQIDWAKPNPTGSTLADPNNYILLAAAFRSAIASSTKPTATLSISAIFDPWTMNQHFNLTGIAPYLDWINVRPFWYWGGSDSVIGHTANLASPGSSSPHSRYGAQDIQTVISKSVPSCKIIMAIPAFGFAWQLPSAPSSLSLANFYKVGTSTAIFDGSENGRYIDVDILPLTKAGSNVTTVWDSTAQASVYYQASSRLLFTYESTQSVNAKMQYVVDNNLAGILVDDMGCDMNWNLIATAAFNKFRSLRPCVATSKNLTTRRSSLGVSSNTRINSASYQWRYPSMPITNPSTYASSASADSSANGTQIDMPFWAAMVSLPLQRSLTKYSSDRKHTELQFFIADASNALSIDSNQIVDCVLMANGPSASILSFTLLPGSHTALDTANEFFNQMQDSSSRLRQGALLQFAPEPPFVISITSVRVRRCSGNMIISASSQCSDLSSENNQSHFFMMQTTSIIASVCGLMLVLALLLWICVYKKKSHLRNVKGQHQQETPVGKEVAVGPTAVPEPVQNLVSFFHQGPLDSPTPMLDVASYYSSDDAWHQQQQQQQRHYRPGQTL